MSSVVGVRDPTEQSVVGRETMSPSLQGDKLGSKIRPKSEAGVHFIPLFTDSERSRKREQYTIGYS